MRKNATATRGRKNYKNNAHQFPSPSLAREFRNHVWAHENFKGCLALIIKRFQERPTVHPDDRAKVAEILRLTHELRQSIRRDDSRFEEWEI